MNWYKQSNKIKEIIVKKELREEKIEICPNCNKEIREKSTYLDQENDCWVHRPCQGKFSRKSEDNYDKFHTIAFVNEEKILPKKVLLTKDEREQVKNCLAKN